jgi:hypothetical protein
MGQVVASPRDCTGKADDECAYPAFYDSTNLGLFGQSHLDYALIVVPYWNGWCGNESIDGSSHGASFGPGSICARTKLAHAGWYYSDYSASCYKMTCDTANRLVIAVGTEGATVVCTAAGERKNATGFTGDIECPDPAVMCGALNYSRPAASPTPAQTWQTRTPPETIPWQTLAQSQAAPTASEEGGLTGAQIGMIVGAAVVAFNIVTVFLCLRRRCQRVNEYSGGGHGITYGR